MFQPLNENYKQNILQKLERQFFMQLMGVQEAGIEPGKFTCLLNVEKKHLQHKGFVHGGVLATLADIAAGFAAVSLVKEEQHVVTVELKVSYLNPAVSEKLKAVGWVLKAGRKLHFCEAEVYGVNQNNEVLVAKASATMAVLNPEDVLPKPNA